MTDIPVLTTATRLKALTEAHDAASLTIAHAGALSRLLDVFSRVSAFPDGDAPIDLPGNEIAETGFHLLTTLLQQAGEDLRTVHDIGHIALTGGLQ